MNITRREFSGIFAASAAAAGMAAPARDKARLQPPYHKHWTPEVHVTDKNWDFGGGRMICLANRSGTQMLSTVFVSKTGHVAVVDGGYYKDGDFLFSKLMELGGRVDHWFITHAHCDHFGALSTMMKRQDFAKLSIGQLVYSFPDPDWMAKKGEPRSKDQAIEFLGQLSGAGKAIEQRRYAKGEKILLDGGISFEVLNDYNLDIIRRDPVNGTTTCLGVDMGNRRILVTGDVSADEGAWLAKTADRAKFKADMCFLSHHGQQGAPKEFYAMVAPEAVLWPAPQWLWDNDAGGRGPGSGPWHTNYTKCWMQDLGIKKQYLITRDYIFA